MAKSLIEQLQAKGVKVFSSTPLWEKVGTPIQKVKISENAVVVESEKYPGSYQLVVQEGDQRVYIPLKQGAKPEADEFTIQEFAATREWPERNISAGETRIFAI